MKHVWKKEGKADWSFARLGKEMSQPAKGEAVFKVKGFGSLLQASVIFRNVGTPQT
jgi:hypothetical protein